MCERLPGNRCASHVKGDVDRKAAKAMKILIAEGVDSPSELQGTAKAQYTKTRNELLAAQEELKNTPESISAMSREATRLKRAGDKDAAVELEHTVFKAKALRKRRSDALKKLERSEKYVADRLKVQRYVDQFDERINEEIALEMKNQGTDTKTGEDKDRAELKGYNALMTKSRLNVNRLKKAKTAKEKLYAQAVDADDTDKAEKALTAIEKDALKISYYEVRGSRAQDQARIVDRKLIPERPWLESSNSGGCGGGGGGC
jgi:hypothetical protein